MSIIETINRNIKNIFVGTHKGDDFNLDELSDSQDNFVDQLYIRGFEYNESESRWEREWTTKTKEGIEIVLEVFEKDSEGDWSQSMYGNEGSLFYEEKLPKEKTMS